MRRRTQERDSAQNEAPGDEEGGTEDEDEESSQPPPAPTVVVDRDGSPEGHAGVAEKHGWSKVFVFLRTLVESAQLFLV